MLKILFYPLAFCLACYGLWEFVLSFQYKAERDIAKDWTPIEARLVDRGDGMRMPGLIAINPASFLVLLISKPFVEYKYTVNGKKYHHRDQLPPTFAPVRMVISSDIEKEVTPDPKDIKDLDLTQHIRYNPETGKPEIPDLEELLEDNWDQYLPKVTIKYNPSDPEKSITDPDKLKGNETLLWSGVWCMILAGLAVGAMKFHEWVTKPTELPDPFGTSSRSVKY